MSEPEKHPVRPVFFHYVEYSRENPHPKFTVPQLEYIRSIDDILTPQEVDAVSRAESFRVRLEDGEVRCREVPGLRPRYGNTVVYIQRYSNERFARFMEKVMDQIAGEPQGSKMFLRFISPVRVVFPDVGTFYPISYGVGAFQWRDKVRQDGDGGGAHGRVRERKIRPLGRKRLSCRRHADREIAIFGTWICAGLVTDREPRR